MATPPSVILLLEDDPTALRVMGSILRSRHQVVLLTDPRQLGQALASQPVDVLLLDLGLPHVAGETLMPLLAAEHANLPVIVVTGTADAATAMRLVRQGAFDYLVKPVEPQALLDAVERALSFRRANRATAAKDLSRDGLQHPDRFAHIVTINRAMIRLFHYIEAVAPSANPVLITGETGTGKELVAQAIHAASGRAGAFVACNIGGLDDALFSDTLFGHRSGAYTGAVGDRPGLVERAAGGTLFLDEIGDLPIASQVKMLRLLQEAEFMPLGSDMPRKANIRVLAATSLDLDLRLADGRFRRDLYYRLCGHRIHLPPLRERADDLSLLVHHCAEQSAKALGMPTVKIPSAVLDQIAHYPFPGNIRELQALVHDAVSRSRGGVLSVEPFRRLSGLQVSRAGLPAPALSFPARLPTIEETLEQLVNEALRRSDGNQAGAARLLGISRQAMSQRMRHRRERADERGASSEAPAASDNEN